MNKTTTCAAFPIIIRATEEWPSIYALVELEQNVSNAAHGKKPANKRKGPLEVIEGAIKADIELEEEAGLVWTTNFRQTGEQPERSNGASDFIDEETARIFQVASAGSPSTARNLPSPSALSSRTNSERRRSASMDVSFSTRHKKEMSASPTL